MSVVADLFPETKPEVSPDEAFDERYTTRETLAWCLARAGVAEFDLDAAACEESHHAHLWYGRAENGLHCPWFGDVWCNPPYSDITPWVEKAWRECAVAIGPDGPSLLNSVTMLIPATRTEQGWYQRWIERYRDGRGRPLLHDPPPEQEELRKFLLSGVERSDPGSCWHWARHVMEIGYGRVRWRGRLKLAHRLAFEAWHGPLGDLDACHYCDVRDCINPEHLFAGSVLDNMRDRDRKWRQARGERANRGHLTTDAVQEMRFRFDGGERVGDLARSFGIHGSTASRIVRGVRWAPPPPRVSGPLSTHFLPGRTAFARPGSGGVGQSGAPFGCVLLVWRRKP